MNDLIQENKILLIDVSLEQKTQDSSSILEIKFWVFFPPRNGY